MRIGRRSVAALLCLLMCLSFVNWNPAKAAAEDDVAAPAETGEPAPESAPQNEAEAKDQAAPAPETPAPEEDDPSAPAEEPAEPGADEPEAAPETQKTEETQNSEPAEQPEPQEQEPTEEPAGEPGDGEDSVVPASLEEEPAKVLLKAGKGQFGNGDKEQTVELTKEEENYKLPDNQEKPTWKGWNFVAWYDQEPTEFNYQGPCEEDFQKLIPHGNAYSAGSVIPAEVSVLYAYYEPDPDYVPDPEPEPVQSTVILDAGEGWFGSYANLPDDLGAPDGYTNKTRTVVLEGGALTKTLANASLAVSPEVLAQYGMKDALSGQVTNPTRSESATQDHPEKNGAFTFEGWYTKAPTEHTTEGSDGTVTWQVSPNGDKVDFGQPVPAGVTRLYAYYSFHSEVTTIFYKLDFNGWRGGQQVMTLYRKTGSTLGNNGVISGVNYAGTYNDEIFQKTGKAFDDAIADYWGKTPMDDYTFVGWFTEAKAGSQVKYDTPVTPGATLYAHWTGPNGTQEDFVREEPKPAKGIFFTGTDFTRLRAHPGSSATVEVQFDPVGSSADITWTAFVYIAKEELTPEDLKELVASSLRPDKNKPSIPTLTLTRTDGGSVSNDDVTLTENGRQLTVRCNKEAFVYISASVTLPEENGGGSQVCQTPVDARITFSHSWVKTGEEQLPTCTEPGYANYKCSDPSCHETHQVVWPANGHRYKIVSKSGTGSDLTWVKECVECKATLSESNLSPIDMRNPDKVTSARTVAEIKELYGNNVGGTTVYVYGKDGSQITRSDALVGTGCTIKLQDASGRITDVPVAVAGDVDGNGTIDSADAKQINESVCGLRSLTGSYIDAAKVTAGAEITAGDVVAVLDLIAK